MASCAVRLEQLCALHDFLAQLVVAQLAASLGQSLAHIRGFYLAAGSRFGRGWAGTREPQGLRIQLQQSWRRRGRVAELET